MSRERSTSLLMLVASAAWFGGLLRIVAEAAVRALSAIAPTGTDPGIVLFAVVGTTALAGVEAFVLWRWSWYRSMLRQTQEDIRSLYGLPPRTASSLSVTLRRVLSSVAIVILPALLVAAVLPGVIAAAVAVLIGLVARVLVAVVAVRYRERATSGPAESPVTSQTSGDIAER
jgi:hypothetical protein